VTLRLSARAVVRIRVARLVAVVLVIAACGDSPGPGGEDAPGAHDASAADANAVDAGADGATSIDGPAPDAPPTGPDAFPAVLDVRIDCRNDCVLVADPASIAVPAGTEFEVNWINVGDTECDVAKVDAANQVPIIIGLLPGTSYHDDVRQWCGIFTGTFDFRVTICTIHSYIPVDCDA
jgi:hypothetical protein